MASHIDDTEEEVTYRELEPFMKTIRKQHEDIVKSSQMRQEFTANVSHELKTPLTAISGYAELIASGMTSGDDTIRFAGEISKSSNRLLTLINDILRLSELDASTEVPMEELDLYELAEKCVRITLTRISAADISPSGRDKALSILHTLPASLATRSTCPLSRRNAK